MTFLHVREGCEELQKLGCLFFSQEIDVCLPAVVVEVKHPSKRSMQLGSRIIHMLERDKLASKTMELQTTKLPELDIYILYAYFDIYICTYYVYIYIYIGAKEQRKIVCITICLASLEWGECCGCINQSGLE